MNTIHPKVSKFSIGIGGRIFLGFMAITLVLIVAIWFIVVRISTTEVFAGQIIKSDMPSFDSFLDLNGQLYQSQAALTGWLITHDDTFKTEYKIAINNLNDITKDIDDISKTWTNEKLKNQWIEAKSALDSFQATEAKIANLENTTTPAQVNALLLTDLLPKIHHALDILDGPIQSDGTRAGGIYDIIYDQMTTGAQNTLTDMSDIKRIEYLLLIIYVIASGIIAFITARTILHPLNNAIGIAKQIAQGERDVKVMVNTNDETGTLLTALDTMLQAIKDNELKLQQSETRVRTLFDNIVKTANAFSLHSSKVAKGDLTQRINTDNEIEMKQLGVDLNNMTESLAGVTHRIIESCHNMVSTLEEVKQSVDIQTTGATEQASSINEITSSLEEIEKSSAQTIQKAKTLGEVAERTREKGQVGLNAVEQSVNGMKSVRDKVQTIAQTILDLSNQTQQVGEITNVVNSLAQQSKMLALNASIEAAKAGEAGKGFAVVAAEVKNLAEQSEQSTSQVQKILEDIRHATEKAVMATEEGTKGVDQGTELVEQTGEVVRNLSDVIHETTIASQQIEAAIRQEGIGIEQITAGMNEINQVTSSFVTSVKQTTEAINDLALIAKSLKEYVDVYKI